MAYCVVGGRDQSCHGKACILVYVLSVEFQQWPSLWSATCGMSDMCE